MDDKTMGLERIKGFLFSILAVIVALLVGVIFAIISGGNFIDTFKALYMGSFGTKLGLAATLNNTVPLIFTGLAVALPFRAGLFNIGGAGQMYIGAVGAVIVGLYINLPPIIEIPLAFTVGIIFGAIWGIIPGYLKAKAGVHEVINTIMMNYIAIYFVRYLVSNGPLNGMIGTARTKIINKSAQLPILWNFPINPVSTGIIFAILLCFVYYWILENTTIGFELKATGQNQKAASYTGINVNKNIIIAMAFGGIAAGLAGVCFTLGQTHFVSNDFPVEMAFTGIAVALLGRNNPFGVIPAALLFGALQASNLQLQLYANVPKDVVNIIQGVVILFVAMDKVIPEILAKRARRKI